MEVHPEWCDPASCTAYVESPRLEHQHRSMPIVVGGCDDDPRVALYVYKFAESVDGDATIGLVKLEQPIVDLWYLTEPTCRELLLLVGAADDTVRALTALA